MKKEAESKLERIEEIEKELGIDLITLFKAFNGLWYRSKDGEIGFSCHIALTDTVWELRIIEGDAFPSKTLALRDYGKTWALTKEELK